MINACATIQRKALEAFVSDCMMQMPNEWLKELGLYQGGDNDLGVFDFVAKADADTLKKIAIEQLSFEHFAKQADELVQFQRNRAQALSL